MLALGKKACYSKDSKETNFFPILSKAVNFSDTLFRLSKMTGTADIDLCGRYFSESNRVVVLYIFGRCR